MRKVVHKLFWMWEFDKEEKWLNEMASKGLALTSVGFCRYEFEDCVPGEYKLCLEFLGRGLSGAENEKYIEFLEETGAEHVGTFSGWVYFRKKTSEESFQLLSDYSSRIQYLTRIIRFIAMLVGLNLYMGCYNLFLFFYHNLYGNLIGTINLLIGAICMIGMMRLVRKRKKLKAEQQIFE